MIEDPTFKRFIKSDKLCGGLVVHAKLKGDYWLDYDIWEVTGLQKNPDTGEYDHPFIGSPFNSIDEAGAVEDSIYLSGFIKWDGCCQFSYNQSDDCTFAHFDDRESALEFTTLIINTIYDLGKELIPNWSDFK